NMTTAFGPPVDELTTTATILPKSDPPTLQVNRDHIFANNQVPVPLAIKASVVNPAFNLNTPTGTELYVQISGLPSSASLVNGLSEPVGSSTGITGTIALTTDQLSDLYLLNTATGTYQLSVQSVSEIDDSDRQTSNVVILSVNVIEDKLTINGTPGDDIIVANGTAPLINGNAGDDLIAAGPGTSTIYPGPGNNDVWGGSYQSSEQDHQDTFAFQQGDTGNTTIHDYEPGIDHIDLSKLLNLQAVWDSTALAEQVVISENAGNTLLSVAGEVITLEAVPMDTLLQDSSPMTPAGYLSALVSNGNLVISNQFGHEGKDILHAPTTGELIADGIVYGSG
ncbi:M10 family metallopeptidase C-terminal domain-containing protein, partial [Endozoicomonas sp. ONNA2]|uniref:M10 family metallopeptidase C-terminal domain-containing protein n=1 Tax=Endozoicomonas sp. ONNA2 TaxID=2828741 RepID=UPI002148A663